MDVFKILAAILHLGNVQMTAVGDEKSSVSVRHLLIQIFELLYLVFFIWWVIANPFVSSPATCHVLPLSLCYRLSWDILPCEHSLPRRFVKYLVSIFGCIKQP